MPLGIAVEGAVVLPKGIGCTWDTIGAVPEGPDHYLFTVEEGDAIRVTYVGLTTHL